MAHGADDGLIGGEAVPGVDARFGQSLMILVHSIGQIVALQV